MRRVEEVALTLALLALGIAVVAVLAGLPAEVPPDPALARATGRLGLGNPVTAVLLDLRGYDTLLEVAVLLVALVGLLAVRPPARSRQSPAGSAVLRGHARLLVPLLVLVAGYLLHAGADRPGGAFQAGALLAGAGVLWRLSGIPTPPIPPALARWVAALGLLVFLAAATSMLLPGRAWMGWPVEGGKGLILAVEAAASLSIGALLAALFAGGFRR